MWATFTNKGAQIKKIVLKNYKDGNGNPVVLADNNVISYTLNTAPGQSASSETLFFNTGTVEKQADNSQLIKFTIDAANGQHVEHQFIVKPNSFLIDWKLLMNGADQLLTNGALNLNWNVATRQMERTAVYERQVSNICFSEGN
jgi:YidC/Oxa1 family membrane protein insertase